jgi:S1-C subfamily serine protease
VIFNFLYFFFMEETELKRGHKSSFKGRLLAFLIFSSLIICCFAFVVFTVLGGYAKKYICQTVLQGSYIWEKVECSTSTTPGLPYTDQQNQGQTSNNNSSGNNDSIVIGIVDKVSPAVVGIGIKDLNNKASLIGTGFLVSADGLIVTNRHVVEQGTYNYYVSFLGQDTSIDLKNTDITLDPVNDIALIMIPKAKIPANVTPVILGDSALVKQGQSVIAIGNPLGKFPGTVTKGIVSGLGREVTVAQGVWSFQNEVYEDVIQTDAAINPGNSGGPLLNMKGEAIGINFATTDGAANISFALPINRVRSRINEFEANGKFIVPFVGVEYRTRMIFVKGQSIIGAEVMSVVAASPAQTAGIKQGDVIVQFNAKDLSEASLFSLIQNSRIGDKISLVIIRNGTQMELEVTIGEKS